jgi:hypothetical protein
LDSFPFRFGYSFPKDTIFTLRDCERLRDQNEHDPGHRKVVMGTFTLPRDGKEYRAKFVLAKSDNAVITVIRKDEWLQTEHKLSEKLRILRTDGDIIVADIIAMFEQNVRTDIDVIRFLGNIISKQKEAEADHAAQLIVEKHQKLVEGLAKALAKTNKDASTKIAKMDEDLVKKDEVITQQNEDLAQNVEVLAERDKEIQRLTIRANLKDSTKQGAPRVINNTFKVVDAGMGNKGKFNQTAVWLDINDGHITTRIWNNWSRGHSDRLAFAQVLIGEQITYDTWGNYNDEWFYHLHKA